MIVVTHVELAVIAALVVWVTILVFWPFNHRKG